MAARFGGGLRWPDCVLVGLTKASKVALEALRE